MMQSLACEQNVVHSLGALASRLGLACDAPDQPIAGLSLDSTALAEGEAFVALAGARHHGCEFVDQALSAGASAVLFDPAQWSLEAARLTLGESVPLLPVPGLSQRLPVLAEAVFGDWSSSLWLLGVTGTDGKTSTAWFVAQLLAALAPAGSAVGLIGTLGAAVLPASEPLDGGRFEGLSGRTTPDVLGLYRQFQRFARQGVSAVAMEVSSHALDQGRVAGLHFDVALLTNLSRDHLDYHRTPEAYAAAKARLFDFEGLGTRVLNADQAFGRELAAAAADSALILYGLDGARVRAVKRELAATDVGAIWAQDVRPSADGLWMRIAGDFGEGECCLPLFGRFNAANALAACAALLARGVDLPALLPLLATLRGAPGRMQALDAPPGSPLVVVDYAHTAAALEQALLALREHCEGRLLCVFGCGGDRDRGKRVLMGDAARRLADAVWITDDNPRGEDPAAIVAAVLSAWDGPSEGSVVSVEHDRAQAIADAIDAAALGDVVLIAGKGHECVQVYADRTLAFDDVAVAGAALAARAQGGAR